MEAILFVIGWLVVGGTPAWRVSRHVRPRDWPFIGGSALFGPFVLVMIARALARHGGKL